MFSIENFEERPIKKDGNCLFRAVSIYVNPTLQTCRRMKDGRPTSKTYEVLEDNLASNLRCITTTYMTLHREKFENALHFDDDYYESIDERISVISNDGEHAGNLELFVLSKILNIQINTFVRFPKNSKHYSSKYNLVSKIGNYSKNCNLLLESNHYHLLKINEAFSERFNAQLDDWNDENPEVAFNDIDTSDDESLSNISSKNNISDIEQNVSDLENNQNSNNVTNDGDNESDIEHIDNNSEFELL